MRASSRQPSSSARRSILDGVIRALWLDAHGGVNQLHHAQALRRIEVGAPITASPTITSKSMPTSPPGHELGQTGGLAVTYNYAWNNPLLAIDTCPTDCNPTNLPAVGTGVGNGNFTGTACEESLDGHRLGPDIRYRRRRGWRPPSPNGGSNCASNASNRSSPGQKRHGALAASSQELTSAIKLELTAFISYRQSTGSSARSHRQPDDSPAPIPNFRSLRRSGIPNTRARACRSSYGPVLGDGCAICHIDQQARGRGRPR
jgi:hypothetical protein